VAKSSQGTSATARENKNVVVERPSRRRGPRLPAPARTEAAAGTAEVFELLVGWWLMTAEQDPRIFDLYKLAVEMADRVSARRGTTNTFFLTAQTTFVAVLAIAAPQDASTPTWQAAVASAAGVLVSVSWWLQLRSYRALNSAKFSVINEIEKELPIKIFTAEWLILKKEQPIPSWRKRYAELGDVERIVPWIFAALYVILFVANVSR
jgi:hypothetical protein